VGLLERRFIREGVYQRGDVLERGYIEDGVY
jgi:hypothetical protein